MSWWNLTGYEPVIPCEARGIIIALQCFPDYVANIWNKRRKDPEVPAYVDKRDETARSSGKWPSCNARVKGEFGWHYELGHMIELPQNQPAKVSSLDAARR